VKDFEGLVALVTGGASGIGASTAAVLRDRGARIAVLDIDPTGAPEECLRVEADTTDGTAVRAGVQRVVDELGGLDVLVNNAGIGATGDVTANDEAEWRRLFDVNVLGVARVTRAALPHLRGSAHPSVVNVGSAVAVVGVPNRALYSATKGAVLSLTLAMAADHVREGIRVNAVAPGTADTPWVARLIDATDDPEAELAALEARQPIGRLVGVEEVANAIAYLASPLSGSTTGTVLGVDGGMATLRLPT
jgi:NAD(P)-dependent dehydrogenase (short-subunit alcohol dehydrogenase family)